MSTLEPIYQKVQTKDVDEIELQDITTNSSEIEDVKNKAASPKVIKKAKSPIRKCCRCFVFSYCFVLFAVLFVTSIVFVVAGFRVKHCIYPSVHTTKAFSYKPELVDHLAFDIPSGSISVHTCQRATNVTVKVTTGAKSADLMSKIKLSVVEASRSLAITAQGPSFNLQNCQIVHVEVVVPAKSLHLLSISASADVGYISLNGESYTFENVNAKLNVGFIKVQHVTANDISASVSLGRVSGSNLEAKKNLSVKAETGFACINKVSSQFVSVQVEKGYLRACHVTSHNSTQVKVGMGHAVLNDIMSENLIGEIGYGKMWTEPSTKFSGIVSFSTVDGTFDVTAARGNSVPTVVSYEQQNQVVQQIQIVDENQAAVTGKGKFSFKAETGTVTVFLRRV